MGKARRIATTDHAATKIKKKWEQRGLAFKKATPAQPKNRGNVNNVQKTL